MCVAHNFKGYDSYFILTYLYDNKVRPGLIMNGAKIMEMTVAESDIRFIDSLNFLPMPVSKFPKTLGLTKLTKGYFPHFFNTEANQHYMGPLPDAKYYDPDGMKPEAREAFYKWYNTQCEKQVIFNMEEELLKYCRSDVDILKRCCLNFTKTVKGLCKINPFEHCITIAFFCNLIFHTMFFKKETIAIIPHVGYQKKAKQTQCRRETRWTLVFGCRHDQSSQRFDHARTVRKDASKNDVLETTRLASGGNVEMCISPFSSTEHGGQNVRGQFEARRNLWGSGQCHQIAGEDRINHNKNQVRGFYQSLPGHQLERCVPCGSSHHFHGEHTP